MSPSQPGTRRSLLRLTSSGRQRAHLRRQESLAPLPGSGKSDVESESPPDLEERLRGRVAAPRSMSAIWRVVKLNSFANSGCERPSACRISATACGSLSVRRAPAAISWADAVRRSIDRDPPQGRGRSLSLRRDQERRRYPRKLPLTKTFEACCLPHMQGDFQMLAPASLRPWAPPLAQNAGQETANDASKDSSMSQNHWRRNRHEGLPSRST